MVAKVLLHLRGRYLTSDLIVYQYQLAVKLGKRIMRLLALLMMRELSDNSAESFRKAFFIASYE